VSDPSQLSTIQESDEELSVQEGYAAWSDRYDDDGNPLTALEGPAVWQWFGSLAGKHAIDVGCGTGRHTRALCDAGARVTALDLTPEMMNRAREKLSGRSVDWVRHALPDPLPFSDSTFDLAVLGLVLEHVDDIAQALTEVARVLKQGGLCIASGLHSDRTAEGQRARFIDPETGIRRPIRTIHRLIEDYLTAGRSYGLVLRSEQTLIVGPELAARLPRAARYVGMNLGWVIRWSRGPAGSPRLAKPSPPARLD
jgi:ubiquinone/menaquinone biosynthesis C-methylase UbiE